VLADQIAHGQSTLLGPVRAANHARKALSLSAALRGWAAVIHRLAESVSEHALADWLGGTALPVARPSAPSQAASVKMRIAGDYGLSFGIGKPYFHTDNNY
jgi:hypothetical protein